MDLLISAVQSSTPDGNAPLPFGGSLVIIFLACGLGLAWAIYNWFLLSKIQTGSSYGAVNSSNSADNLGLVDDIGAKIALGAREFLKQQYIVCMGFVFIMFFIIYGAVERFHTAYTAFAFVIGALTSMICGAIGMLVATYSNYRTAYRARTSLADAFQVAYQAGCVMGFALVSTALLMLIFVILIFRAIKHNDKDIQGLFEAVAGYGLGGSTVALFARVGGGIYTKAADVGADLVGKVEQNLPEDSPKNPATIADNVGDNVGDVAGMGADLFGSFAQATCAALVISSTSLIGTDQQGEIRYDVQFSNLFLPLVSSAFGILCCIITSVVGIFVMKVDVQEKIERNLKYQLIISTVLLVMFLSLSAYISLPAEFMLIPSKSVRSPIYAYLCQIFGLISGLIIGGFTEYMTSHSYSPVRQVAQSCRTGAATNIIYGLALGYLSTVVPVICIALTAYLSNLWLGYYGIALAALGMLSNLPIALAIDGYGPISDNAGGIAEMAGLGEETRNRTDALDAAGNTTAAIGKGFAIGSAALVALALYGGFLHNAHLQEANSGVTLNSPAVFTGLLLGAMLPYVFSAFTMKSVGKAALGMVEEVRRQIREQPGILQGTVEPDYRACVAISTRASLREMVLPGLLVILTPLLLGIAFGPKMIAGFLPGAIISGVQMATSSANTGGAWDNAKKYIQGGNMIEEDGTVIRKHSEVHKAAVVGDTVGDPLKDTSGPSLNILIKLMAILSLVFADLFYRIHS